MNTSLKNFFDKPVPTHRCKECGAMWRFQLAQDTRMPTDSWSLHSPSCGPCCDNVEMRDQIAPLTVGALLKFSQMLDFQLIAREDAARRVLAMINTPELGDFLKGTHLEAVHQVERWGVAHDRAKRPADWF
jgi:hypothetical protein